MNEKLIFNRTWGREDPERATLPFVAANVAATARQDAVALCTIEAVRLGTKGGTDGIEAAGLPKLCYPSISSSPQRQGLALRRLYQATGHHRGAARRGHDHRRRGQGGRRDRARRECRRLRIIAQECLP